MKKFILMTVSILALVAGSSQAFDKEKFQTHFKKAFNLDSKMEITVGDPAPSTFAGLLSFPVAVGGQQQTVYITPDEKFYFWGSVLDINTDPDAERASKLNLENVHIKGAKNAPVTIVEFSDIQCPNCQKSHAVMDEKLFKDFPNGKVRLVFKHFPLTMHDWAEPAAVASECAGRQGNDAFWKMTDMLFRKGEELSLANIKEKAVLFAGTLKLDAAKYKSCLEDPAILEKIKKDKAEGAAAGVNATPTFFINGRMIRGSRYEDVKSVITEKLAEKTKKK